jgi:hypothetical protein
VSRLNDVPQKADSLSTPPDRGSNRPAKGRKKASFLFAMEYKKGEINGQMVFSQWLLITFTPQGKCIARDRSGGPLLG